MNRLELPIGLPCAAEWNRMVGDDLTRYCRACHQEVHDLSARSEADARAFLRAHPRACVRYTYDGTTGAVLHETRCGPGIVRRRVRLAAAWATGIAAVTGLAAAILGRPAPPRPERVEAVGGLAAPMDLYEELVEMPSLPPPPPRR
jgi:hypothetical protein